MPKERPTRTMEQTEQRDDQSWMEWAGDHWRGLAVVWLVIVAVVVAGRLTPFRPVQGGFEVFGWVTEQGIEIAQNLFEDYGYLTVFLAPMLENTIFIGALIPGTLVMLLAGLSAHDGLISFWPAVLLGAAGAMIGDTISYGIGRFGWGRLGPEARLVRWAEERREPLMNHTVWLVLSYHFAGYSRLVGPAASGFLRIPLLRWMVLDYIGVVLWVFTFLGAGYLLGTAGLSLDDSDRNVQVFEAFLFVLFVVAVLSVLRAAGRRRRQQAVVEAHEAAPPRDEARPVAARGRSPQEEERVG